MPLESLRLQEFGAFEDVTFEFCPGLNVIIGENATGKSHAMKAAYSILRSLQRAGPKDDAEIVALRLRDKLSGVFRPQDGEIGRLVRRAPGSKTTASLRLEATKASVEASINRRSSLELSLFRGGFSESAIFLPSREVLALFEGFIAAYDARELSFDETYYDTCKALSATLLRGVRAERARKLLEPLREALGGTVSSSNGRFYVKQGRANMEAHLVSEGLRKIASVYHLINNGSLAKNSVLFWDEPEANLNPRLVDRVARFLLSLIASGMQVIVASHDYLLTHRLSLQVEYQRLPKGSKVRFFALSRRTGPSSAVELEHGDTLADLEHNAILEEFARFYDDEEQVALGVK
ncbi:MAG: AAA family ATPase [Nannocystaceae bacterium]